MEVLTHLRAQTGHDFTHYKRATILRRIARRMQVNLIETIPDYLGFLRNHSAEPPAFLQDLLIGVTHFFRDQEVFAALEANIPQLFAGKTKEDQVRAWVVGCATGEEAYSIAMLLFESRSAWPLHQASRSLRPTLMNRHCWKRGKACFRSRIAGPTGLGPALARVGVGWTAGRYRCCSSGRHAISN